MNPVSDAVDDESSYWLPVLAGLPVVLCLLVMALPVIGKGSAALYRMGYVLAYVAWAFPLTVLQRQLWRRGMAGWKTGAVMLAATYIASVITCVAMVFGSVALGWRALESVSWSRSLLGVESIWLALVAFSAIHAVVRHYDALRVEQARRLQWSALARDAQLRALRYQIQPHFLFNTLNAISALVDEGRRREARGMLARLADYLRALLDSPQTHEIPLAEEIALTEAYLDIERARLGERLQYRWHVGANLMGARVPALLLQPLVENAVRHGISRRTAPGTLDIHVNRDGQELLIRVSNDVADHAGDDSFVRDDAVGLRNVRERLIQLHPTSHSFSAGLSDDGRYEVRMAMPLRFDVGTTLEGTPA
ncbi:sensor histidine kinase [Tahibacter amnicola]|uniref:Histidine kinase n=1 Tax=Tahibacter amnicola TaxID=2976241 RepID=A0ABY6B833_9GAMM|nr:histidine kinase [Tahibacter amnicola]UXI66248.1 histidine kinase [Tahibacter amnicola]